MAVCRPYGPRSDSGPRTIKISSLRDFWNGGKCRDDGEELEGLSLVELREEGVYFEVKGWDIVQFGRWRPILKCTPGWNR
jgi:hypothetical protein